MLHPDTRAAAQAASVTVLSTDQKSCSAAWTLFPRKTQARLGHAQLASVAAAARTTIKAVAFMNVL
jgi:hypothetical protein